MPSRSSRRCRSTARIACGLAVAWAAAVTIQAQSGPNVVPAVEPALRRWIDVQTFTIYSRYRFTTNNKDVTTADQLQSKDTFQARLNFDPQKRYSVTLGYGSGGSFISSWNNWGLGNETRFISSDHYLKQLFASAAPVQGLELQSGGLFLNRGDGDEWLAYDDDGYEIGKRVSVRRPQKLYLDEMTVTRGAIGPLTTPSLVSRGDLLNHPNYTQVLGLKRFSTLVSSSLNITAWSGGDTARGRDIPFQRPGARQHHSLRAVSALHAESGRRLQSLGGSLNFTGTCACRAGMPRWISSTAGGTRTACRMVGDSSSTRPCGFMGRSDRRVQCTRRTRSARPTRCRSIGASTRSSRTNVLEHDPTDRANLTGASDGGASYS